MRHLASGASHSGKGGGEQHHQDKAYAAERGESTDAMDEKVFLRQAVSFEASGYLLERADLSAALYPLVQPVAGLLRRPRAE